MTTSNVAGGATQWNRVAILDGTWKHRTMRYNRVDSLKIDNCENKLWRDASVSRYSYGFHSRITTEQYNITVDNLSTAYMEEEEMEPDKMGNSFDIEYVEGISQQPIGRLNYGLFVAAYAKYLRDELQVPNDGLDAGLFLKIYANLLSKYKEAKVQKSYASDIKDPQQPEPNFIALDEE
ncbi:hypothetical protein FXO38_06588 [Capsicum annuum]|nr:hypothetical protein FXO38_06588 [Capsicum annuum]KAF3673813.1 hypothetical protein FXO37_06739 [Capsicum annuum]